MKIQVQILFAFLLLVNVALAQRVGIGTTTPAASAQLDVSSTNKGLLIPRVSLKSATDVVTIANPAVSLMVYNTNAALASGTGYYYWSGTVWVKLLTNTAAGGDLSGDYPNPVVTKINTVPVPVAVTADYGKTLRYNWAGSGGYELRQPIEPYESIAPGFITVTGQGFYIPTISKSGDNANMLPLCYGNYSAFTNSLSGNTSNVSIYKITTGSYRITIDANSIGLSTFNPSLLCTLNDFGVVATSKDSPNSFLISTWLANGYLADMGFSFIVFNR